jgi:Family of unknown function (DUF6370)
MAGYKFNFMKLVFTLFFSSVFIFNTMGQTVTVESSKPDPGKKIQLVEAACGQCKLGLPGKSCDLAVRINGKSYFVDGTNIDSHGDAHAKDGFCEAIRKAEVQGEVINDRFKATYFKLVSPPTGKK